MGADSRVHLNGLHPIQRIKLPKMNLRRIDDILHVDEVPLNELARFAGTPVYVYSWKSILNRLNHFEESFAGIRHQTFFAVKANSNLAILKRLANCGCGFDVVSGGELERVLRAGGNPSSIVFSGVGKSEEELSFALKSDIGCINLESVSEYKSLVRMATTLNVRPDVAIRFNPEVDTGTHPYIATALKTSKFGVSTQEALNLAVQIADDDRVNLIGVACHLGSQIPDVAPYESALRAMLNLVERLDKIGISVAHLNVGGGFGIRYVEESEMQLDSLANVLATHIAGRDLTIGLEPGRFLVGPSGLLLTTVRYTKIDEQEKYPNFAVVDAAMNDLLRPALYDAHHEIEVVDISESETRTWNVVGPICESGDFLGLDRTLALAEGDLLAIRDVGAYGFVLSSNYNSRARCAEVLVDGSDMHIIRSRETMDDLLRLERFA